VVRRCRLKVGVYRICNGAPSHPRLLPGISPLPPPVDDNGKPVLDDGGKPVPVMTHNPLRPAS
jgi:hypothetical protein